MENAFEDALLKWANLPSDDVGLGGVFARELLATRAQLAALQIETLKAQLAEAEADADRLASRWVVLGQNCCSFCGKPVKWSMIIDAECPIADHAPDCPILHHQKRKEGK